MSEEVIEVDQSNVLIEREIPYNELSTDLEIYIGDIDNRPITIEIDYNESWIDIYRTVDNGERLRCTGAPYGFSGSMDITSGSDCTASECEQVIQLRLVTVRDDLRTLSAQNDTDRGVGSFDADKVALSFSYDGMGPGWPEQIDPDQLEAPVSIDSYGAVSRFHNDRQNKVYGGSDIMIDTRISNDSILDQNIDLLVNGTEYANMDISSNDTSNSRTLTIEVDEVEEETDFTIEFEVVGGGEVKDSRTSEFTIVPRAEALDVKSIDGPDVVQSGDIIEAEVTSENITHDSSLRTLDLDVEYVFNRDVIATETIEGSDTVTTDIIYEDDPALEGKNYFIDAVVDGVIADVKMLDVEVEDASSNISIDGVDFPDEVNSGDRYTCSVDVTNSGSSTVEVVITDGGDEVASKDIPGNTTSAVQFEKNIPVVDEESSLDFNVAANVGRNVADSVNVQSDIALDIDIEIDDVLAPSTANSGEEIDISISISNNSSSTDTVDIVHDGNVVASRDVSASSTSSTSFTKQLQEVEDDYNATIDISAEVGGRVQDTDNVAVSVKGDQEDDSGGEDESDGTDGENGDDSSDSDSDDDSGSDDIEEAEVIKAKIDTDDGTVKVLNSDSGNVTFDGTVVGARISLSDSLESDNPNLPGFANQSFTGEVQSDTDEVIIEFNRFRQLQFNSSKTIQWYLDDQEVDVGSSVTIRNRLL